jgi:hypothetical protein
MQAAGATASLSSPSLVATVLAPTNAAFASLLSALGVTAAQATSQAFMPQLQKVGQKTIQHCRFCFCRPPSLVQLSLCIALLTRDVSHSPGSPCRSWLTMSSPTEPSSPLR